MIQNEIQQKNCIIADYQFGKGRDGYAPSELMYHISWDWIVPVIQDIVAERGFMTKELDTAIHSLK